MVYDGIEPEFNCQGIYSQFWWDYLRQLPFEFQKLNVSIGSLESLIIEQQKEINLFNRNDQQPVLVTSPENSELVEEWRNYGFWGKLKFYYNNNGMKQTIKYACQKIIKGGA